MLGGRNPAYLCLMELLRSLREICGDQRGTDSVSVGREERRRAFYTEDRRLAWARYPRIRGWCGLQPNPVRGRLTALRKNNDHITC